jgi:hypothetical protein
MKYDRCKVWFRPGPGPGDAEHVAEVVTFVVEAAFAVVEAAFAVVDAINVIVVAETHTSSTKT